MGLSIEDLLKPRYKVIADYPRSRDWIGKVIIVGAIGEETQLPYYKYPHLYKALEWWEEREEKDMPEYVVADSFVHNKTGVFKIKEWKVRKGRIDCGICDDGSIMLIPSFSKTTFLPATQQEYTDFLNK